MYTENKQRIQFLDGLRGIAIILVVLYHTYAKDWAEFIPLFAPTHNFPLIKFGDVGVPLFFLISGFVIMMTLEKCHHLDDFMFRRWLRLFPGMLIATILIMLSAPLFTSRPLGDVRLIDTVSGLTFISPSFYDALLSDPHGMLERGFWTLFVEVKFYLVAGWLYFLIGPKKTTATLVVLFLSITAFNFIKPYLGADVVVSFEFIYKLLDVKYYGWFAAGALFYQYYNDKRLATFLAALLIALINGRDISGFLSGEMVACVLVISIFAGSLISKQLQRIFSHKSLTFIGFISYPLYLIHENATISTIVQLHQQFEWVNIYVLSLFPLSCCVLISWLMAAYLEPGLRTSIKKITNMVSNIFSKRSFA